MENREIAIQLSGVKKMYKLGQIGGGTLQGDLQSWWARIRGKEDPNTKIGTDQRLVGQTFMALNGSDLTVYKGEALGIIGGNGAGKSTMLKLLSRVTAPTEGEIDIYGRIASMLEVGTGFNGEMTGRENVYMNGAILGMTKAEIDAKMEDIIEFSEVREFIDTPVKRYSSGMYVKLAFSVAAHLDSEIMIMDEVLAVGDAKFQNKCLGKMSDEAHNSGKAVLYVSHNMGTIQRLCTRCIVLDHGRVIFDGPVDDAIGLYLSNKGASSSMTDLESFERNQWVIKNVIMSSIRQLSSSNGIYMQDSKLDFELFWKTSASADLEDLILRATIIHQSGCIAGFCSIGLGNHGPNERNHTRVSVDLRGIVPGNYYVTLDMNEVTMTGADRWNDCCEQALQITIEKSADPLPGKYPDYSPMIPWKHSSFGSVRLKASLMERGDGQ